MNLLIVIVIYAFSGSAIREDKDKIETEKTEFTAMSPECMELATEITGDERDGCLKIVINNDPLPERNMTLLIDLERDSKVGKQLISVIHFNCFYM